MAGIHHEVTAKQRPLTTSRGTSPGIDCCHPNPKRGSKNMQKTKFLDVTPKADEWEAGLEESLRSCRQIVSEYRAMLTAACKENPSPNRR